MDTLKIVSTNYTGQSAVITYYPDTGGTINLGTQVLPYDYVAPYFYGTYSLFFPAFGSTCTLYVEDESGNFLLQENGDYIFQENYSKIIIETAISPTPSLTPTVTPSVTLTPTMSVTPTPTPTPTITMSLTPTPSPTSSFSAGIFKTTYAGYHNENPAFFATATPTAFGSNPATSVQTTSITEPSSDDGSDFSCQWLGYFKATTTETYTFFLSSDDGSYLWIGANALSGFTTANANIDNGGAHGPQEVSSTFSLTAGVFYPIRIQFGEIGGGDVMTFSYSSPTITKTTNVTGLVFYNPSTNGF
jgi:hypothetical protein